LGGANVPPKLKKGYGMKKICMFLVFMLGFSIVASATSYYLGGVPTNVTVTTTDVSMTAITDSGNTKCVWTQLLDSDDSCAGFYITNPGRTYNIRVTYNSAYFGTTYTVNDYITIISSDTEVFKRDFYATSGVYVTTTFTTVYDGMTAPTVSIHYESFK
jgi:hypothetical protein